MIEPDRLVSSSPEKISEDEKHQDRALRPKMLSDYVGQPRVLYFLFIIIF